MYQNYIITKEGSIISKYTGKQVYVHVNKKGYHFVRLYVDGKSKTYLVHRLVAELYVPNPDNKPEVNHDDGNKSNNNDWNLVWSTGQENVDHAVRTGLVKRGSDRPNAKFTDEQILEVRKLRKEFYTYSEIADMYGSSFQTIHKICKGETYTHI